VKIGRPLRAAIGECVGAGIAVVEAVIVGVHALLGERGSVAASRRTAYFSGEHRVLGGCREP
jgi:hypothetical protein